MLGESERLVKKATFSPWRFFLRQLLEHVNGDLVQVEIFLFLLIEGYIRLVRFLAILHLVLPGRDDLEQGPIPLASLHLLEEYVMDAPEDKLLTALPNLLRVHILLQELVIILNGVDVLAKVTKQIVQEEVEGLQEVSVVLNILDDFTIRHTLFDSTIIAVLQ